MPFRARDLMVLSTLLCACFLSPVSAQTQTLFSETFNEGNDSESGISAEGIAWSSTGSTNGQSTSSVQDGVFQSTKSNTVWTTSSFGVAGYTAIEISATLSSSNVEGNDNLEVEVVVDGVATQVYFSEGGASSISNQSVPDGSTAFIRITANTGSNGDTYLWDNVVLTGTACSDSDSDGICDASDLCSNTSACNYDGGAYANATWQIPGTCDSCDGGDVVDGDCGHHERGR